MADISLDNAIIKEAAWGKVSSLSHKRQIVTAECEQLPVSERRACRVLGQARNTQAPAERQAREN